MTAELGGKTFDLKAIMKKSPSKLSASDMCAMIASVLLRQGVGSADAIFSELAVASRLARRCVAELKLGLDSELATKYSVSHASL